MRQAQIITAAGYYLLVGNSAVQEVSAGKNYYHRVICLVISKSVYTSSPIKLESATNTKLLSHNDLNNIKQIIT